MSTGGKVPNTWGTDLHGIESTVAPTFDGRPFDGRRTVALTFDACGSPRGSGLDTALLDTLTEFDVPATVFLNERWILANPRQTDQLIANPLLHVENHGSQHVPLSVTGQAAYGIAGTPDAAGVIEEIESNRAVLRSVGVVSSWFRAGTAHYDDVAVAIARDLGVRLAGFSVNADFGATARPAVVEKQLLSAPDGAIVLAHMNQPASGTAAGLRAALPVLVRDGVRFVRLDPDAT
ncbi:MAG: polysaccharide deacetylase family protein [Rhodococcus sp. (in: high G+C Gram-positive bacteria)]|uniref:polysaccharide deacetylase family protein n=1 Tax=Rhodococcus sp. TaxID=1831 RepID=UPI003BB6456F